MGQSQERERGKEEDMSMITILMLLLMMMHAAASFNPAGRQSHREGIRISGVPRLESATIRHRRF